MDKIAIRGVIQYFYLEGKKAKEIYNRMKPTLGKNCPSYESIRRWVKQFKRGRASVKSTYGRRRSKTIGEEDQGVIIDKIRETVMNDQQLKLSDIATAVGISERQTNHILRKVLNMKKRSEKWVPRKLKQKNTLHEKMKEEQNDIMSEDSQDDLLGQIKIEETNSLVTGLQYETTDDMKETSNQEFIDMHIKEMPCEDVKEEKAQYTNNNIIGNSKSLKAKIILRGKLKSTPEFLTDDIQHLKICTKTKEIKQTTSTAKEYKCSECNQSYPHFHSLNAHRRQVHTQEKLEHSMKSERLENLNSTVDSNETNHDELQSKKNKKYQCNTCLKFCKNAKSLENHISLVHMRLRRFACRFCHLRFRQKVTLKTHERIHTGEKPYACYICDLRFVQLNHMNRHQKQHEIEQKLSKSRPVETANPKKNILEDNTSLEDIHQCDICEKRFKRKNYLRQHVLLIHRLRQYICQFCGFESNSKTKLRQHEQLHTGGDTCKSNDPQNELLKVDNSQETNHKKQRSKDDKTKNIHQCDTCQKRFRHRNYLRQHIMLMHRLPQFVCQFCGFQSCSKANLKQHERIHTGEKPFACDICGLRFRHYATIRKHRKTDNCNRTFSNISSSELQCKTDDKVQIKMEIDPTDTEIIDTDTYGHGNETLSDTLINDTSQTIDNIQVKKYENLHQFNCTFCDLFFTTKQTLKAHELMHSTKKSYACNICDCHFLKLSHMNKHQKRHMSCQNKDISENRLIESGNLQNELLEDKASLKKITTTADYMKNMYQCDICQKKFKLKSNLQKHEQIHTGEKPYSCDICSRRFRHSNSTKRHQSTHGNKPTNSDIFTGEKPYSCDICGRHFRHSNSRKRHQATHRNKFTNSDISTSELKCRAYDEMHIKMEIDTSDTVFIKTSINDDQIDERLTDTVIKDEIKMEEVA